MLADFNLDLPHIFEVFRDLVMDRMCLCEESRLGGTTKQSPTISCASENPKMSSSNAFIGDLFILINPK